MLYLIDTSVWINHLRSQDNTLVQLLKQRQVLTHSCVIGELACGTLPHRQNFLEDLRQLPRVEEASFSDCLSFLERHRLFGKGLGWVDMQLLASAAICQAQVLSYDKALSRYSKRSI